MNNPEPVLLPAVVDFFIYDVTDDGELHVRTEKPCRRKFAASQVLPTRKVSVAGTTLSMPCMPHAMLAQTYGPEYLVRPEQSKWAQDWHDSKGSGLLDYCRSAGL